MTDPGLFKMLTDGGVDWTVMPAGPAGGGGTDFVGGVLSTIAFPLLIIGGLALLS